MTRRMFPAICKVTSTCRISCVSVEIVERNYFTARTMHTRHTALVLPGVWTFRNLTILRLSFANYASTFFFCLKLPKGSFRCTATWRCSHWVSREPCSEDLAAFALVDPFSFCVVMFGNSRLSCVPMTSPQYAVVLGPFRTRLWQHLPSTSR